MNKIFINKKEWNTYNEEELKNYVDNVFNYYKEKGFPYFSKDKTYRNNEFKKLKNFDFKKIIDKENKIINQTMHGLALAWSYMPHSFSVVCNNKLTPLQLFNDDDLFRKVIERRIKMGDNISDNGIRKMMKIFTNSQSVSNFRPTAAAAIYHLFCEPNDSVWDISSGFGGRLLGASLAGVNYTGTEPSTLTFNGLLELKEDFCNNINVNLIKTGSEDFKTDKKFDFIFTSPPYFDLEKYSDEPTQSYKKFPDKELWLNEYLLKTFKNAYKYLKSGKYMAINIANTKKINNLEEEMIKKAIEAGFELVDTWRLALSNPNMKNKDQPFKFEPIFIFYKK